MDPKAVLIALGGNAISLPGERGDLKDQYRHTDETMTELAAMINEGVLDHFVMTHGNGPQVGNIILRSEYSSTVVYPLTVDVCVSDSEGGMGYMIQQCLYNCLRRAGIRRTVTTVITQIVVDANDPAMKNPTKYIGPMMTEAQAKEKAAQGGWIVKEDPGRGWRRVIASPQPLRVVELEAIRALADSGTIVVAAGGGGIPVVEDADGTLRGIEGVIDKDLASAMLAAELGIGTLLILTGTDGVFSDYKKPSQKHYPRLDVAELKALQAKGHFPAGSMGPKVEAALRFLSLGGKRVIITEMGRMGAALKGTAGTTIVP